MVDFTLANAVRSGLLRLIVTTQYRPETLEAHLERRWVPLFPKAELLISDGAAVCDAGGYGGTADAVAATRTLIEATAPDALLVLSGDHIYQMDYSALIAAHRASGAMVTLAVHRVPVDQASAFGVVHRAPEGKITEFEEKPARPVADPACRVRRWSAWASMFLIGLGCVVSCPRDDLSLILGTTFLPAAVATGLAAADMLPALQGQSDPYWRDVRT